MRAHALLPFLLLCACAPEPPPRPELQLDCKLGFAEMSRRIAAEPGLSPAQDPSEPYRYYKPEGGGATFVVTVPGAPGHPAIFRQAAAHEGGRKVMRTTGCPFGDRNGYDQVLAYLESLS